MAQRSRDIILYQYVCISIYSLQFSYPRAKSPWPRHARSTFNAALLINSHTYFRPLAGVRKRKSDLHDRCTSLMALWCFSLTRITLKTTRARSSTFMVPPEPVFRELSVSLIDFHMMYNACNNSRRTRLLSSCFGHFYSSLALNLIFNFLLFRECPFSYNRDCKILHINYPSNWIASTNHNKYSSWIRHDVEPSQSIVPLDSSLFRWVWFSGTKS